MKIIKYLSALPIVTVLVLFGASSVHAQVFTDNLYFGLQSNSQVSQLQEFLTAQGLYHGPITGNFYFLTLSAVKAFQTQEGISPAAGYFGPITRTAVNKVADAEVGASNSQAISETGTSTPQVQTSTDQQLQLQALLQELAILEKQLQTQQGTATSTTPQPSLTEPPLSNSDWSTYPKTLFSTFANAPGSYLGDRIEVKGEVVDFLPIGGRGGTHNYIETADPNAYTSEPVMLEIDNNANYFAAVNALQKQDLVAAYGTGVATQSFTINGQTQSVPVLDVTRLDNAGGCDIWGCLVASDTVIFPSGISPTPTPAPTATPTSTVTYAISASASTGGTISPSGSVTVNTGSNQSFTITPNPGYLNGGILVDGQNVGTIGYYTFTSVSANHTIEASFTRGTDAALGSLTVGSGYQLSPGFSASIYSYTVVLPAGTSAIPTVNFKTDDPAATGVATQASQLPGSATVVVTAQDGIEKLTYTVNFVVSPTGTTTPKSSADYITQFSFAQFGTVNLCGSCQNFTFKVPIGTNLTNLAPDVAISDGATISPASGIAQDFTNPVTYTVTAADGITSQKYVVTVIPTPNTDGILRDLRVNGITVTGFGGNTYSYSVTLPGGTTLVPTVAATPDSSLSTVVITQASGLPGSATVVVTAQDGVTRETYTINFSIPVSYTVNATVANSNSPSSTMQCNVNGNVFTCTSSPNITVSLPSSLTNTPLGISYVQPLTINDPYTTSQNFRWNIIGNYLPPGIGLAFSSSQALECSGTSCFFTSPPSGLALPANSPGELFGTPTTKGTYNFTLQAIDSSNYFALPTFSISIN